uniref:CD276 antigen homolog n=1 Tax=Fundulus heteroclitus TaxID=8078 RepID=A0A3Q2PTE8_FUNHE
MQSLTRAIARMSLLLCLQSVSCQIQGFVKKAAFLPCIYSDSKLTNAKVFWRDTSDRNVLDIKDGKEDVSNQNEKYKGRVSSYPEEYSKGNFSITLKNLQLQDSGVYDCFIYSADTHRAVSLIVSAEPTRGPETPAPRGAATKICAHLLLLAAPFLTSFL